jgi:cytosine/adenosine deaminase-related metal-dependent hydrolase
MRGMVGSFLVFGDGTTPPLANGALALHDDGRIEAVGPEAELRARFPALSFERHDAVLTPGFVNAHTHLELSELRGKVAGGRGFVPWVEAMLAVRGTPPAPPDPEAIDTGVGELLSSGTVAVGEVTNTLASVEALGSAPLVGRIFHEVFAMRADTGAAALEAAQQARSRIGSRWPASFGYALAPHTPYTLHPDILQRMVALNAERGVRGSLHLAEHPAERAFLANGGGPFARFVEARVPGPIDWSPPGVGSVEYVEKLGALGPQLIAVHLSDANRAELDRVAACGAPVVLCPRSNLFIELRLPPLLDVLAAGIKPGLGSDSLASAPSLDVLADARTLHERFPGVSPRVLLAMATGYGAAVLGFGDRLGRLAAGLSPGVVAFDLDGQRPADPEAFVLSSRAKSRRVLSRPTPARVEP